MRLLPKKLRRWFLRDILRREMAVAAVFDFELVVPLQTPGIGQALLVNGHRELDQYEILLQLLRPGAVVMDIGANIGYYAAIEARRIGDSGLIYAFEPDPRNLDFLARNVAHNGIERIVRILPHAVSNADGTVTFNLAEEANLNSIEKTRGSDHPSIVARGMQDRKYLEQIPVKAVDLCGFLETAARPVDIVRMDVEGYEVEILGSLADRLDSDPGFSRAPSAFVFEPHSWEYGDDRSLRSVLERLGRHGYRITFLGSRNESTSPIHRYGYRPCRTVRERLGITRGVYRDLAQDHAIELASEVDGVTTVCLQREPGASAH